MAKVKVRVGQVWRASGEDHLIIRIDLMPGSSGRKIAVGGGHDGKQRKCLLGYLDKEGYPEWDIDWCPLFKDAAPTTLMDCFMQVPAGYCACNIPIVQCKYHGTSKV